MDIAILGGTGAIGQGLALRWALETEYGIIIGSREHSRAVNKAREYEAELDSRGRSRTIDGSENETAAASADVVVLAVPAYHVTETIDAVEHELDDAILISPAVGMTREPTGMRYDPPAVGSVTELVAEASPPDVPVVGAFHNLAAGRLSDLDAELGIDTLLVGENADAKETVATLTQGIEGLRPLDAGPLANAREVEAVTPLLINVARNNERMHDLCVRFT